MHQGPTTTPTYPQYQLTEVLRDIFAQLGMLLKLERSIIGIIATVGLSMFPFILPSSLDPQSSLTVWNASSSHLTLFIMLVVTLIFLPIVLAYTAWVFKILFGRVTIDDVRTNPDFY